MLLLLEENQFEVVKDVNYTEKISIKRAGWMRIYVGNPRELLQDLFVASGLHSFTSSSLKTVTFPYLLLSYFMV